MSKNIRLISAHFYIPETILLKVKRKVIVPLKDAMHLTEYKEHDRNYKFHVRKKIKGSKKETVLSSHSFKLKGVLKHEMYLKTINPARIKAILGKDYGYKIIIRPDRAIDMNYESKNKRRIELVIFFNKHSHHFIHHSE